MNKSKIEWADLTWNPITGCLHGREYCYARKIAQRFAPRLENGTIAESGKLHDVGNTNIPFSFGFDPTIYRNRLDEPLKKTKPSKIFVCSMADLFGEWVPDEWIWEVFNVAMESNHKYLFLTKNPKRYDKAVDYFCGEERGSEPEHWNNFWFGTTITCQADTERIKPLTSFSEGHKFLSIEPLMEEVKLDLSEYICPKCGSYEVYRDRFGNLPPYFCDDCGEWEGYKPKPAIEWNI